MANITQKELERRLVDLENRIRIMATPFVRDSTEKKLARAKRARLDKFFFATVYFPHYITLTDGYQDLWKRPRAEIDWVKAGFASFHRDFFALAELKNQFVLLAAFRESAKDTLLGKIDVIHKIVFKTVWFIPIVAFSLEHAATKVAPLKIEFENNERLKGDFGDLCGTIEWEYGSFITKEGIKVKAYGRDQSLRGQENFGHRPDWIMLNDVEDPTKTTNPAVILKYVDSIRQDILKSVNSPRWGAMLLCNYVSKQSIVHELVTGENTAHYNKQLFRAMVPNEKRTAEEQELAHQCRLNRFPDPLKSAWEYRHPTLRLLEEQKNDPETFDAEMMMRPKDRKNKKFRDTDFTFYTHSQLTGLTLMTYTAIDPSATEAGDYKAVVTLGVPMSQRDAFGKSGSDGLEIYVLNAWIQQASIDALLEETFRDFEMNRQKIIGVEMISFASLLEREYLRLMRQRGKPLPIYKIQRVFSKDARIEGLVPLIRSRIIKFDPRQGDQGLLIRQLKVFPDKTPVSRGGLGDDGPDALALCVRMIQDFPHGREVEYTSVQKRQAVFAEGAY